MQKFKQLEKLKKATEECRRCGLYNNRGKVIFGEGNINSKVMFVGESPGISEEISGRPFVGRAGKFLMKMLESVELERSEVYITNVLKCRPKIDNRDRPPEKGEITACKPCLLKQIRIIKPKVIVLLGNVALHGLIDEKLSISKVHGKMIEKDGITYFPTFHPSAAMRFTKPRLKMEGDFKKLKHLIK